MIQIYTAIITPFDAKKEINFDLFDDLIRWQAREGIDGLVVCGTNGEFASLSLDEIKAILKFAIDRKKGKFKIIAGTGRVSIKETIALCKFVEGAADKALVVPPYYFKELSPQGIHNYFKQLFENTRIPIILYNIPKYTGVPITPELINKLKTYENLEGVKDSTGTISNTEHFLNKCPNIKVYAGSDALLYESFKRGAAGAISSISNIFPKHLLEMKRRFLAGDKKGALSIQEEILKIRTVLKQFPNRSAVKVAISLLGYPMSYVRPPLIDLTEQQQKELKNKLKIYLEK